MQEMKLVMVMLLTIIVFLIDEGVFTKSSVSALRQHRDDEETDDDSNSIIQTEHKETTVSTNNYTCRN
jgi:hypothetical protein